MYHAVAEPRLRTELRSNCDLLSYAKCVGFLVLTDIQEAEVVLKP